MQATSNAGSLERLALGIAGTRLHQTGHLILSELDLAAAEGGERDVGDLEGVGGLGRHFCSGMSTESGRVRRGRRKQRGRGEERSERSEWKD